MFQGQTKKIVETRTEFKTEKWVDKISRYIVQKDCWVQRVRNRIDTSKSFLPIPSSLV